MTDDAIAAPAEGQAAAPVETGNAASWVDGFNDDLKGYIETKGFKDPGSLAESYRNLEKLRGVPADRLVQWPADMSDTEAMAPVYAKMGRPETPDGYTNIMGEGVQDDVFKAAAAAAHQVGIGDQQFQAMQKVMAEQAMAFSEAQEAQAAEAFDQWKSSNQEGFNNAARMMAKIGMTDDGLEQLLAGDKSGLYDFLAKVASNMGEAQVIQGEQSGGEGFGMSPAAAKQKIGELFGDDNFMKQYTSSSKQVRQAAIDRMMKLQEIAARA